MVLDILKNLSLDKTQILIRILDGGILFIFATVFLTSIIINIKNRNLKSILISTGFIFIYMLSAAGMFFGVSILNKIGIPITNETMTKNSIVRYTANKNYYIAVGIFAFVQIVMIVLIYIFADPFAREKKIEHMKETGEYYELMRKKREKEQNKIDRKNQKKKTRLEKKQEKKKKKIQKKEQKKQQKMEKKKNKEKQEKKGL